MDEQTVFLEAAALVVGPLLAGAIAGLAVRHFRGGRVGGVRATSLCGAIPVVVLVAAIIRFPLIGLWDAVTLGILCSFGVLWSAHRAFSDPRNVLLSIGSAVVAFMLVESAARLFLDTPPHYWIGDGPHLLLIPSLRTLARPGEFARPEGGDNVSLVLTTDFVCSIAYESSYHGIYDFGRERKVLVPTRYQQRADAERHVLHLGDSMVFGAGLSRSEAFTARLEEMQPSVEHVNGGVPGAAPDDYLVLLRSWMAHQRFNLVVLYLYEGNDYGQIDAPHPCSNWRSILDYRSDRPELRYRSPRSDGAMGLQWLMVNSPLPYLGRALIVAHSHAAAFAGSAFADWIMRSNPSSDSSGEEKWQHIQSILHSARADLRRSGTAFMVVVLPAVYRIDETFFAEQVREMAKKLDIVELDATDLIRAALSRGEKVTVDGSHFDERTHRLLANWLDERIRALWAG